MANTRDPVSIKCNIMCSQDSLSTIFTIFSYWLLFKTMFLGATTVLVALSDGLEDDEDACRVTGWVDGGWHAKCAGVPLVYYNVITFNN